MEKSSESHHQCPQKGGQHPHTFPLVRLPKWHPVADICGRVTRPLSLTHPWYMETSPLLPMKEYPKDVPRASEGSSSSEVKDPSTYEALFETTCPHHSGELNWMHNGWAQRGVRWQHWPLLPIEPTYLLPALLRARSCVSSPNYATRDCFWFKHMYSY